MKLPMSNYRHSSYLDARLRGHDDILFYYKLTLLRNKKDISFRISEFSTVISPRTKCRFTHHWSSEWCDLFEKCVNISHKEFSTFIRSNVTLCPLRESILWIFFKLYMGTIMHVRAKIIRIFFNVGQSKKWHIKLLRFFNTLDSDADWSKSWKNFHTIYLSIFIVSNGKQWQRGYT